ncbi:CVNH domain-containing protein [Aspergillus melleus]|uniref:CVNH domain-containing protein n=1 Tax=Aspergillus melleus TaxID=138277 RepID=UPI001E8CE85C|nr:uncharacterized protein LDX57_006870 [Aspergillus melleus]KAH8429201.1 hypothetical protein LDX57_006870 [Aspergillus melleus]
MSLQEISHLLRIEVRDDHTVLVAEADDGSGETASEIILDEEIGNTDGYFVRGDGNFTQSAGDIELDSRDDGPWLTATLNNVDGEPGEPQGINLAHHIESQDGQLVWVDPKE